MRERPQSHTPLIDQDSVKGSSSGWHRDVLEKIEYRLSSESEFPCLFSKNAFAKRILRFVFVESTAEIDIHHLAEGLTAYVELSREWNGNLNTACPLIVAFSLDAARFDSPSKYDTFGWSILQRLHNIDPRPWPISVGTDPDAPTWSMCFNGMPIFCNMSHPAHRRRRSRNLGDHFIMVMNPRERFDIVAGDTPAGRKVRSNIRARIERYDGVPHSSQLASYGDGGIEWLQYSLAEDDAPGAGRCPFKPSSE